MGLILSIFFGFVPMLFFAWLLYWLDRYEKEPKILLGVVFVWGAAVSAGVAYVINTLIGMGIFIATRSEAVTEIATGSFVAPPVEESLKGLAVLLVFLIFRHEFDSTLDGIVYAGITALGFAATENSYYIYNYGYQEAGYEGLFLLVFVRVFLVGWQHPFYTAFIGIGLAAARFNKNIALKLLFPTLGLAGAIITHSIHNTLATLLSGLGGLIIGTIVDWSGWLFMFGVIIWAIYRERKWIKDHLREEIELNTLSKPQYRTAISAWAQSAARGKALLTGRFLATNRFYNLTAELAYKKHQRVKMGDEGGNTIQIKKLRRELAELSSGVVS
ncbi:MAG: PrsW family intramembrane metalloprotease [Chloroflexota bacterium]|nr:PrsW family intramembrane metalloprotease [Chloroflexota bacterium]